MIYVLLVFLILFSIFELPGLMHRKDGKELFLITVILLMTGLFSAGYVYDWDFLPTFTRILLPFKPVGDWFSSYFELVC